jgi:hypothetical protein
MFHNRRQVKIFFQRISRERIGMCGLQCKNLFSSSLAIRLWFHNNKDRSCPNPTPNIQTKIKPRNARYL